MTTDEELARSLHRTIDRRIRQIVPPNVTQPVRGTVTGVVPGGQTVLVRLGGSTVSVPVTYPSLHVDPAVGDEVVVDQGPGGYLLVDKILGAAPTRARGLFVDVRDFSDWSASGDKANAIRLAAAQAGTGTVLIPDGSHHLGSAVEVSAWLRGESRDGTILIRATTDTSLVKVTGEGAGISDLTVDGGFSAYANTIAGAVEVHLGSYSIAERIRVADFSNFAVAITDADDWTLRDSVIVGNAIGNVGVEAGSGYIGVYQSEYWNPYHKGGVISRCRIYDCHGPGIQVGGDGVRILDCVIRDNHRMSDITGGGQVAPMGLNALISGCLIDGTDSGQFTPGIEVTSTGTHITGNTIQNHPRMGVELQNGSRHSIVGNLITNNGQATPSGSLLGWQSGILVREDFDLTDIVIVGNQIFDTQATKTQSHGIYIGIADHDDITIVGNDLNGNDTAPLYNGSTATEITIVGNLPTSVNDAGGGAPTTADYLVGTASGSLSGEIVVGTSPGGELGGTWASPTVDATHSGSAHSAYQPVDTDLTAIAALTSAADKLPYATGSGTWSLTDLPAASRVNLAPAVITPTLTASQNDWNPTGLSTATTIIAASTGGPWTLTGMAAQTLGRRITLVADGTQITLASNSGSSSAGNKFICPGNVSLVIPAYGSRDLLYVPSYGYWLVLGAVA